MVSSFRHSVRSDLKSFPLDYSRGHNRLKKGRKINFRPKLPCVRTAKSFPFDFKGKIPRFLENSSSRTIGCYASPILNQANRNRGRTASGRIAFLPSNAEIRNQWRPVTVNPRGWAFLAVRICGRLVRTHRQRCGATVRPQHSITLAFPLLKIELPELHRLSFLDIADRTNVGDLNAVRIDA